MKSCLTPAAVLLLAFAPPAFAAADAGVESAIRGFSEALHSGDGKAAKAFLTKRVAILDETPPYYWGGTNAFDAWQGDVAKAYKEEGIEPVDADLGKTTRMEVFGTHAYAVVPANFTYRKKGVAMRETADLTFVLTKEAKAWKITSWTWTGPEAVPVK